MIKQMDCVDYKCHPDTQLIYMDPPYGPENVDNYYGVGESWYDYMVWLEQRLRMLTLRLDDYNIVIHIDPKASHRIKVLCDKLIGPLTNEIIWCYTGPSMAKRHLPRKHDVLLWYGVGDYIFNMPKIPYTSLSSQIYGWDKFQ